MSQNELHVVFGTGALGKWTARELVRLGKKVRMVSHSGKADSRIPAEVEVVQRRCIRYQTQYRSNQRRGSSLSMRPTAVSRMG